MVLLPDPRLTSYGCRFLADAVEKGLGSIVVPLDAVWAGLRMSLAFDGRRLVSGVDVDAATDAYATDATNARVRFGGGPSIRSAMVFKFCTIAARWNSSRAPERPRSRMRSKP